MKDRMLRGEPYVADDPELAADLAAAEALLAQLNRTPNSDRPARDELLRRLLGDVGDDVEVRSPLLLEYGARVSIGARTFVNFDCVMLDVAPIRIGTDCQIATRVQLITAAHPVEPEPRRRRWEYGSPITIGDNVWIGAGAIVCPGVTIGDNAVVGAGAVVVRDVPAGVVATGVPAKPRRSVTPSRNVPRYPL